VGAAGARDFDKMAPFVASMYKVTYEEVRIALYQSRQPHILKNGAVKRRRISARTMPLISFPWLFADVMGQIATERDRTAGSGCAGGAGKSTEHADLVQLVDDVHAPPVPPKVVNKGKAKATAVVRNGGNDELEATVAVSEMWNDGSYTLTSDGKVVHRGEILNLFDDDDDDEEEEEEEEDEEEGVEPMMQVEQAEEVVEVEDKMYEQDGSAETEEEVDGYTSGLVELDSVAESDSIQTVSGVSSNVTTMTTTSSASSDVYAGDTSDAASAGNLVADFIVETGQTAMDMLREEEEEDMIHFDYGPLTPPETDETSTSAVVITPASSECEAAFGMARDGKGRAEDLLGLSADLEEGYEEMVFEEVVIEVDEGESALKKLAGMAGEDD